MQNWTGNCYTQHAQLQTMMFQNTKHLKMSTADMARSSILWHLSSNKQTHNALFSLVGNLPTQVSLPPLHEAVGFRCKMLGTVQHLDQVQSLWTPCHAAKTKQYCNDNWFQPFLWFSQQFKNWPLQYIFLNMVLLCTVLGKVRDFGSQTTSSERQCFYYPLDR